MVTYFASKPWSESRCTFCGGTGKHKAQCRAAEVPLAGPVPRFVGVGAAVMQGGVWAATAASKTMAKRIANALNRHRPNREGV